MNAGQFAAIAIAAIVIFVVYRIMRAHPPVGGSTGSSGGYGGGIKGGSGIPKTKAK
jgi:hypothetical protein